MASDTCDPNTIRWPFTDTMTSPALRPALSAGSPPSTERMLGFTSGSTPMVPTSNRASPRVRSSVRSGRIREPLFAAAAHHHQLDVALGPRGHGHVELLPRGHVGAAHADDHVAGLHARPLGRRTRLDGAHHGGPIEEGQHLGALHQHQREQAHGQHEVHRGAGNEDLEALPLAPWPGTRRRPPSADRPGSRRPSSRSRQAG